MSKENVTPTKNCVSVAKVNEYCRCCKKSLNVLYGGKIKSICTENLFEPSKRDETRGQVLSRLLAERTGIVVERRRDLSVKPLLHVETFT